MSTTAATLRLERDTELRYTVNRASELIVRDTLHATASGIVLRSASAAPTAPEWYGVRVATGGTATLSGVTVRDGTHCAKADSGGALIATDVTRSNCGTAPVISGPGSPSFAEHGAGAVATYTATDAEQDAVTWSLPDGGDAAAFAVDRRLGVLRFRSPPDFEAPTDSGHATDADSNNVYHVTVRATDGQQASSDSSVTVTVTDVAESAAAFSASGYRVPRGGSSGGREPRGGPSGHGDGAVEAGAGPPGPDSGDGDGGDRGVGGLRGGRAGLVGSGVPRRGATRSRSRSRPGPMPTGRTRRSGWVSGRCRRGWWPGSRRRRR